MSAFCDIALIVGLTFGGACAEPVDTAPAPTLPPDDESAWALPAPPPPAPEPAAPRFPPVIIRQEAPPAPPAPPPAPEPEPEPVLEMEPAPPPPPDPYRLALEAAWARPVYAGNVPTFAAWTDTGPSNNSLVGKMPAISAPAPDPLALKTLDTPPEDYDGARKTSTLPVDNTRKITQDRYIPVQLETGINTQVGAGEPGSVILQTTRDVFGYHGRMNLVPKGSRLVCTFMAPEDMGSSQIGINCERILMAGHRAEILNIGSNVTNQQGWLGVAGEVDNRFWQRYGNAFLLTGISTAVRYAAASTKTEDADGEVATAAAEKASEELSNKFGEITADMLEKSLDLKPIITIPQGTRLQIRPATDWYIQEVE